MMKRIHGSKALFRDKPKVPVFGVANRHSLTFALGLALLSLVFLSACNMLKSEDVYDETYYKANFIGAIGFDQYDGANIDAPTTELTGLWDLAYRYESDWETNGSIPYITLTDTGNPASSYPPVASGLDSAARVYRLELVNLINGGAAGGEFETAAGAWISTNGSWLRLDPTNRLFGNGCMQLSTNIDGSCTYNTASAVTFYPDKNYTVFFRFNSASGQVRLSFPPSVSFQVLNTTTSDEKAFARYSLSSISAPPSFKFMGPEYGSMSQVYVDNFRVSRSTNMVLRLKLIAAQTTPQLEQGTYSFSVWTHEDTVASDTGVPRYDIDSFVIRMASAEGTGSLSTTSATYAYVASSGWKKYTATLEPGALTFDEGTTAAVLTLVLDFSNSRPGSVFIAQPELRFHPDGL